MSEHIPAWKKIGLKVKQELESDPLAVTTHLETATVTNRELKKINKQKRKLEEDNKDKKAPKRVKVPKSERGPPPEKDQLVYLKQYHTDKDNWKFSKQKQNWILKNIKEIPTEYEAALSAYLEGLQGGSRTRVIEDLKSVAEKWNKLAKLAEEKIEQELERKARGETEKEKTEEKKVAKPVKKVEQEEEVDYDYAVRSRDLIEALTGELLVLTGVEVEEKKEQEEKTQEQPSVEENGPKEVVDNLTVEEVDVSQFESQEDAGKSKGKKKSKKSKKKKSE